MKKFLLNFLAIIAFIITQKIYCMTREVNTKISNNYPFMRNYLEKEKQKKIFRNKQVQTLISIVTLEKEIQTDTNTPKEQGSQTRSKDLYSTPAIITNKTHKKTAIAPRKNNFEIIKPRLRK
ncbi:MAG: hypothetical protein ACD_82C00050G0004 [uncultured bacterium]|jgi:hypothetical protein|nr:MAG: hypothetical protein ACD_82C00050G0004 [uncultured bacterium]KKP27075.1 MAG: hypothetical protein UR12_C0032G0005 [candidate division TM6 bacterium GW2011_GWF2_30_66]